MARAEDEPGKEEKCSDFGERCDCEAEKEKPQAREVKAIRLTYQAPAVLEVKGRPKYPCPFR